MALSPNVFKQMTKLIAGSMSAGQYDVRLAKKLSEIEAAQRLRYKVLFKESGGRINREMLNTQREEDQWDDIAYHVIVIDRRKQDEIVGTVRLVSGHALEFDQNFYTEHAFDLDKLLGHYQNTLELSRACVCPEGRGGAILMLMWKFTMRFIQQNDYDVLFGCASFSGTDYHQHTEILSYLYDKHLAAPGLMPVARSEVESVNIKEFQVTPQPGKNRGQVPTLLRGYLKIGARISDHAIIDQKFNTTFVAIYIDTSQMFSTNHVLVNKSV
ncbi:MAG: putative hemolysin [Arenicella sp.]|jgi:putative hemolysin